MKQRKKFKTIGDLHCISCTSPNKFKSKGGGKCNVVMYGNNLGIRSSPVTYKSYRLAFPQLHIYIPGYI